MDGISASEIGNILKITPEAVKMRFKRRNIKPFRYLGPVGLYKESDIEAIKDAYLGKHPAKKKPSGSKPIDTPKPKVKPKTKAKKT
jgi:hypothetical protein